MSRSSDIILLLGAGASVEAGIPASATMIDKIESLLAVNDEWQEYRELYHHVKSALYFSAGIKGRFNLDVSYNIEVMVNALYELERNEEHPLYPFIASWNSRFVGLAGPAFERIKKFRKVILRELKKWMCPENTAQGDYFRGLSHLQSVLTYPLRIFSLNYDLCVERLEREGTKIEAGFPGHGPDAAWDWERFEGGDSGSNQPPQILLYKLHGSIDWKRDTNQNLYRVEQIENVEPNRMEIIFGRDFKLEAADPYLFYAYEFRRHSLLARLIVTIGYSFGDWHINKMLVQAMREDGTRKIMVVSRVQNAQDAETKKKEIADRLKLTDERIIVVEGSAKTFLESADLGKVVVGSVPQGADEPF
ncbi:SIR2 family protein [Anatilimnocola floriformis]|uniref:SIR2 family protein n=1 Tax=Anatilimnocola floriformis TaxID=2948575 RepID=UPI0020C44653|nr:SIR2 family protein [Anatilimnocola floriformis]